MRIDHLKLVWGLRNLVDKTLKNWNWQLWEQSIQLSQQLDLEINLNWKLWEQSTQLSQQLDLEIEWPTSWSKSDDLTVSSRMIERATCVGDGHVWFKIERKAREARESFYWYKICRLGCSRRFRSENRNC